MKRRAGYAGQRLANKRYRRSGGKVGVPRGSVAYMGPRRMAPYRTGGFYGANARLKRAMQGLQEKKVVDTAAATYVCSTTGSVTAINLAAEGTDFTNRLGRKTTNVAVQLEGLLEPIDTITAACKARIMLIYDAQPNGALPAITDILTAATSQSFMNLNNRDRFKILCDINRTIGGTDNTATQSYAQSPSVYNISVYRKINLDTIWSGTTAAIGSVGTGALLLVTIGDQGGTAGANFNGAVRVRFVDA